MTWVAYDPETRELHGAFSSRVEALSAHPGAQVFEVAPRRVPKVERCEACGRPRINQPEWEVR